MVLVKGKNGKLRLRVFVVTTLLAAVAAAAPFCVELFDTHKQVTYYLAAVVSDWIVINLFALVLLGGAER